MAQEQKEKLNDLVYSTLKDLTFIGTQISDDGTAINILISFGSQTATIPISIEDIVRNRFSCKGFLDLIKTPLEALLK